MSFLGNMLNPFRNPLKDHKKTMGFLGIGGQNAPPRNPLDSFQPAGSPPRPQGDAGGGQLAQALAAYRSNGNQRPTRGPMNPRFGDDGDTGQMPPEPMSVMAKPAVFDPKGGMSNGMPQPGNTGIVPPDMGGRPMPQQGGGVMEALQLAMGGTPGAVPQGQPADFNPRQAFAAQGQPQGLGLGSMGMQPGIRRGGGRADRGF